MTEGMNPVELKAEFGERMRFPGSTHNFQADTPTQNIIAMYEVAKQ